MSSRRDISVGVVTAMPFVVLSITLFWLSSVPELSPPDLGFAWQDKVLHVVAYFAYGLSTIVAVVGWTSLEPRKVAITVLLIAGIFGITDEIHQSFVPGRDGSFADYVADLVGITSSLILQPLVRKVLA